MKISPLARTLNTDHLPSGSPNGRSHDELRTRNARLKGDLDGSPVGRNLDTSRLVSGEPPVFKADSGSAERGAERGAERLENTTDNSSPRLSRLASKWEKIDWLRVESTVKRQRSCMSRPLGKSVGIRLSEGVAGVSGVMHCGRIACPNCGPRIGADRRQDINRAVENWRAGGGVVVMLTLTLRHHKGQRFADLAGALSGCWAAATGGKMWLKDRESHGIRHTLRVWEEKWSIAAGWHCHVHALLFLDAPTDDTPELSELLSSMFARWSRAAVAQGLAVPLLVGQDLHVVTGADAGEQLGGYFAKQAEDTASNNTAESMAWELSNPNGKAAGDSFTPAEILEYAVGGDDTMASVWAEYEQGMIGRRTIAWSKGLRDAVGLDVEKTEQEAADEETGTKEDTVISMTARSWYRLTSARGKRYELLRLVMHDGPEVALAWLHSLGCVAVLGVHDFDHEGDSL